MSQEGQSLHKMMPVFNELRLDGELTDAVIQVQDVEFKVHKNCLSCIPYFRSLFTQWSPPEERVYELPFTSAETMKMIIDHVYTGSLALTDNNVMDLLEVAAYLTYEELLEACSDYLITRLSPHSCINTWKLTSKYYLPKLCSAACSYVLDHFEEVALSGSFLELSMPEVEDIISSDNLMVRQESAVFESVIRWVSHSPAERRRDTHVLLSKVRLATMDLEHLNAVMRNELVRQDGACTSIVSRATSLQLRILTTECGLTGINDPLSRPRLPPAILLATGGWSGGDPTNAIEAYDVRAERWSTVENTMERPRAYHGSVFLGGFVYCVGGFDRVEYFNSVRRFNPITHTWMAVSPMYYRRCYVSVSALNGLIYAMGGFNGQTRHDTAEYYCPETNQWHLIASMHERRSDASCTAFQGKIYICGGFNGHDCLPSAEFYTPETDHWTLIRPMSSPRSGVGVMAFAGRVYAVGGFDGTERLRSAEAYNPQTNTWAAAPPMLTPRSNFGLEVIEDKLIVVGGFDGFSTTFNAEFYSATTNRWTKICSMNVFRSALSCCVISGLTNMETYAYPREPLSLEEEEEEEEETV
ncbi:kelch-like protein 10 [Nothobranchius furzeri]|uniref:Kelch like family member 10 n=1 Tax=Nothobranchius furzeri TaxID=105023 RepID=A0A8C6LP00_NOTFU|nr:kelch-like protein 10 [Nothobranchius furzeri]